MLHDMCRGMDGCGLSVSVPVTITIELLFQSDSRSVC